MTPTHCPKCGHDPDSIEAARDGWCVFTFAGSENLTINRTQSRALSLRPYEKGRRLRTEFVLCTTPIGETRHAMQRHTDAARAEAAAREEAGTAMTESRHA